jgi:cytochrome c biogenesis protein CcdA
MTELFVGVSILGGFLGGMVALLAPCCVTVLLPAYFAATFSSKVMLVRMTLIFAAGIATIILPIALGLATLGSLVSNFHSLVFAIGGAFMIVLGVMTLRGRGLELPFGQAPVFRKRPGLSLYLLGIFSGAASSCCAPVLIGVLTLTALTSSFPGAVVVSLAYVFGMVFPLFLLALAGDRFGWSRSRLVRGTMVHVRFAGRERQVHSTNLIGGVLFLAMGVFVLILAATGIQVVSVPGQDTFSTWLRQMTDAILTATTGPVAVVIVAVIALFALYLVRRGLRSPTQPVKEPIDGAS